MRVDGILNLIYWQWGWREVATTEICDLIDIGRNGEATPEKLSFGETSISLLLENDNLIPDICSSPDRFQVLRTLLPAL